jgi:hypothetical protein
MKVKNLTILAEHFEKLAAEQSRKKIYMGRWVGLNRVHKSKVTFEEKITVWGDRIAILKDGFCGSTACVLGHGTSCKALQERGLNMELNLSPQPDEKGEYKVEGFQPVLLNKKGEKIANEFQAVQQFFGVSTDEAEHLFGGDYRSRRFYTGNPEAEPTLTQVAASIRKFIKTRTLEAGAVI